MKRLLVGVAVACGAVAVAYVAASNSDPPHPGAARAVVLGGGLGTLIAAIAVGAQVAWVQNRPASHASFGAMVGGFFAKGLALLAGVFLLHATGWGDPAAFGAALLLSAGVVTAFGLSSLHRLR